MIRRQCLRECKAQRILRCVHCMERLLDFSATLRLKLDTENCSNLPASSLSTSINIEENQTAAAWPRLQDTRLVTRNATSRRQRNVYRLRITLAFLVSVTRSAGYTVGWYTGSCINSKERQNYQDYYLHQGEKKLTRTRSCRRQDARTNLSRPAKTG